LPRADASGNCCSAPEPRTDILGRVDTVKRLSLKTSNTNRAVPRLLKRGLTVSVTCALVACGSSEAPGPHPGAGVEDALTRTVEPEGAAGGEPDAESRASSQFAVSTPRPMSSGGVAPNTSSAGSSSGDDADDNQLEDTKAADPAAVDTVATGATDAGSPLEGPVEQEPDDVMEMPSEGDDDAACDSCVSEHCGGQLAECEGTVGCTEILECVLDSGCSGIACYCGTELLTSCLAGQSNGSCKATVLEQEGGREPTLQNPSGGPASDTAFALAQCVADEQTCAAACQIEN
jgi:hypothetical protein